MSDHIGGLENGQRLCEFTPHTFLSQLKRLLAILQIGGAEKTTLKCFRAGKATAMAAEGRGLGEILTAGEWRSKAFLRYIDEDMVDAAQLLSEAIEQSDGE